MAKRLLIIENHTDTLEILKILFTAEGFEVDAVEHTADIFYNITAFTPDILVIDHILNGTAGGELCRQMKSNPATKGIPVILISAYPNVERSVQHYACDIFIPKPFDIDDLVQKVNSLLVNTY
jgi:DNA-binding response OmpR family regulator